MDEHIEFDGEINIDFTEVIDTDEIEESNNIYISKTYVIPAGVTEALSSVAEAASNIVKSFDISEIIRTLQELIKPIIDACNERMRRAAEILVDIIQSAIHSFGSWLYSSTEKFIWKYWTGYGREIVERARLVVLLNATPFIKSLISSFEKNSSNIRDVFLIGTHNKSSSDDALNISFT